MRLVILFFLVPITIFSQNSSFKISDPIIGWDDYAYLGLNNKITFIEENHKCETSFLTSSNGAIVRDSLNPCDYFYLPLKVGWDTITFYRINGRDTVVFNQKRISVRKFPWTLLYAGIDSRTISEIPEDEFDLSMFSISALNTGLSASRYIETLTISVLRNEEVVFELEEKEYSRQKPGAIANKLNLQKGDSVIITAAYKYCGYDFETDPITLRIK